MAIHYLKSSDSYYANRLHPGTGRALCGRKAVSAVIEGWDGVTCKNCLKRKGEELYKLIEESVK